MGWQPGNVASPELSRQLRRVRTSRGLGTTLRPCAVRMRTGEVHERVLFLRKPHGLSSGALPLEEIQDLWESPHRLSPRLATRIHAAGLTHANAMEEWLIYTLVLASGDRIVVSGGIPDFPPSGIDARNIVDIVPHEGVEEFFKGDSVPGADCLICYFVFDNYTWPGSRRRRACGTGR